METCFFFSGHRFSGYTWFSILPYRAVNFGLAISVLQPLNFHLAMPNYGNTQSIYYFQSIFFNNNQSISLFQLQFINLPFTAITNRSTFFSDSNNLLIYLSCNPPVCYSRPVAGIPRAGWIPPPVAGIPAAAGGSPGTDRQQGDTPARAGSTPPLGDRHQPSTVHANHYFLRFYFFRELSLSVIISCRAVDPHSFFANPVPAVF